MDFDELGLSPGRRLSGILFASVVLLLANSAYLAAVASPTLFFYANVALHVGLGALVALASLVYGVKTRRRWAEGASTVWIVFLLCAAVGMWLAYVGASRAHEGALYTHAGLAAVAVLLAAAWLDRFATGAAVSPRTRRLATAGVLLLCAAVVVPPASPSDSISASRQDGARRGRVSSGGPAWPA